VTEIIFAVLFVSLMGLTRCYKTTVFLHLLKHKATQTVTCRLLAHTYTVRPKLNLLDLLSTYIYYTSKLATNEYSRNRMSLSPRVLASSAIGPINRSPLSTALLFSVNGMTWRNFCKWTAVHAKIGHVSLTMPLLEVICHPFGKTWYNITTYKIRQL